MIGPASNGMSADGGAVTGPLSSGINADGGAVIVRPSVKTPAKKGA